MMYPRLFLARNLLRDDGVIFVSIDDHELENLRCIMDELFGEESFIGCIIWEKKYSPSNDTVDISYTHDYIVAYSRLRQVNEGGTPVSLLHRMERTAAQDSLYKNPDDDPKGSWMSGDYTCNKTADQRPNLYYSVKNPYTGGEIWPNKAAVWRYSKEQHQRNIEEGRVWWGLKGQNQTPRYKRYLAEVKGVVTDTIWLHDEVGHTDEAKKELRKLMPESAGGFDTPKPTRLLMRMLELATTSDGSDLVLDFFAGSGTTGHAVIKANVSDFGNRRFILVQFPEPTRLREYPTIATITKERLTRAFKSDGNDLVDGAHGFRVLKLKTSNFKTWNADYELANESTIAEQLQLHTDHVLPDRSQEDILLEILLKAGYPLASRVEEIGVAGQHAFSISDGNLIICLESAIDAKTLRAIIALQPRPVQVICLDYAFKGNDQVKTNLKLEMQAAGIEFRTV